MYSNKIAVAVASSLFLLARADLTLDSDDVPTPCSWICSSIVKLSNDCDNSASSCICDHTAFGVQGIAASCAGCMHVNKNWNIAIDRSEVDTTDIDDILTSCGWPRGVWNNDDNTTGSSATVEATATSASSKPSTTLVSATSTSAASSSSAGSTSSGSSTATGTSSGASSTESAAQANAASALAPFGVAGAAVAFAGLVLA